MNSLEDRLQFEELISNLSAEFVNLPSAEVEHHIEEGLKQIVDFLKIERSTLFKFSEDCKELYSIYSYAVEGVNIWERMPVHQDLPWFLAEWLHGRIVVFNSHDDLPDKAVVDVRTLKKMKVTSGACVPLSVGGGSVKYALAIGTARFKREWPPSLIPRLKLVGGIFINALVRKEYEEEINALIEQLKSDNIYLQNEINTHHRFEEIIGKSNALKYNLHQVEQIATRRTPVLLIGETGTGKELVARAIHQISDRKDRPMIKVNCAALPAALIESELFGHEKGTFTSAHKQQIGRFEYADGATIFLDEIGELPLDLQPKLLRVLQDGEFERLGNPRTIKVDVRVIAATNKDIEEAVKSGQFRRDLYYRINVFPISIPPLRERREDIPLLVNAVVQRYSNEMGKQFSFLSKQAIEKLQNYSWPGNVRELENVIERAVILSREPDLKIDLPEHTAVDTIGETLENVERSHIIHILKDTNWKIKGVNGAAEILGINPSTLRDRIEKLGIERPHTTTH